MTDDAVILDGRAISFDWAGKAGGFPALAVRRPNFQVPAPWNASTTRILTAFHPDVRAISDVGRSVARRRGEDDPPGGPDRTDGDSVEPASRRAV
jgi:hypothetical protein